MTQCERATKSLYNMRYTNLIVDWDSGSFDDGNDHDRFGYTVHVGSSSCDQNSSTANMKSNSSLTLPVPGVIYSLLVIIAKYGFPISNWASIENASHHKVFRHLSISGMNCYP